MAFPLSLTKSDALNEYLTLCSAAVKIDCADTPETVSVNAAKINCFNIVVIRFKLVFLG